MRSPTGTLRRGGAAAVLVLAAWPLLAGCSGGSDPRAGHLTETPSPTVSSPSSPSPTSPEQQVEAAVRAYYAELTMAARSSDASELERMTSKQCPCRRPITVIKDNARKGYTAPDASFSIATLQVHDVEARLAGALITTDEAPYDVIDGSGKVVGHVPSRQHSLDLTLVLNQDRWVVANVVELPE